MLALTVLYSSHLDTECQILDADILFGGGFQPHSKSSETMRNVKSSISNSLSRQSAHQVRSPNNIKRQSIRSVLSKASALAKALTSENGIFEDIPYDNDNNPHYSSDKDGSNMSGIGNMSMSTSTHRLPFQTNSSSLLGRSALTSSLSSLTPLGGISENYSIDNNNNAMNTNSLHNSSSSNISDANVSRSAGLTSSFSTRITAFTQNIANVLNPSSNNNNNNNNNNNDS